MDNGIAIRDPSPLLIPDLTYELADLAEEKTREQRKEYFQSLPEEVQDELATLLSSYDKANQPIDKYAQSRQRDIERRILNFRNPPMDNMTLVAIRLEPSDKGYVIVVTDGHDKIGAKIAQKSGEFLIEDLTSSPSG